MNRSARRHRSTKVPNVKLRPPPTREEWQASQAQTEDQRAEQDAMRQYMHARRAFAAAQSSTAMGKRRADGEGCSSDEEEREDEDEEDECAPLVGCTICTTGFDEEKVKLHECIVALGATLEGNLTEHATHLIARGPGSDKYSWAMRLGMPVLRPTWLYDLRDRWQKADPIRFSELLEEHRLDAFEGLTIAMAGVIDVDKRKQIRMSIKGASGQTPTVFKLDGTFTHLLCEDTKSSETLKALARFLHKANRYIKRGEEVPDNAQDAEQMRAALKIKRVWVEWMEDSLKVGGCMEERLYSIDGPRMDVAQRERLVNSILSQRAETSKRTTEVMRRSRAALKGERDPAPRRHDIASSNAANNRPVTKRAKVGLGELVQSMAQAKTSHEQHSMEKAHEAEVVVEKSSDLEQVRAASLPDNTNSPQPHSTRDEGITNAIKEHQPTRHDTAARDQNGDHDDDGTDQMELDDRSGLSFVHTEKGLKTVSFRIDLLDDIKNGKVCEALQNFGITKILKPDDPTPSDFHVVPLDNAKAADRSAPHLGQQVTHFFIERCLAEDRVIRLDESFALQPSPHQFPLPGADRLNIALTGLGSNETGPDRHQVEVALREAGIKTDTSFKRGVHTHLLVGKVAAGSSSSEKKIDRARGWGVPIVDTGFVEQVFRNGLVQAAKSDEDSVLKEKSKARSAPQQSVAAIHSSDAAADLSSATMDASTTLDETQYIEDANRGESQKSTRVWHRAISDPQSSSHRHPSKDILQQVVRTEVIAPGERQETRKPDSSEPFKESLVSTQIYKRSAEQMMEMLAEDRLLSKDLGAASTSMGRGGSNGVNGTRTRRPPPSMRSRFRHSSRTPTIDNRAMSVTSELSDAEQLLNRLSEAEQDEQRDSAWETSDAFDGAEDGVDVQSMRIVYDDPVARRERRKIVAMIDKTRRNDDSDSGGCESPEKKQSTDRSADEHRRPHEVGSTNDENGTRQSKGPVQHIRARSASSSPLKQVHSVKGNFSPTIKARRQPGTANRDR